METNTPSSSAGIVAGRIDRPGDLGRLRRLDRCATEDGFLAGRPWRVPVASAQVDASLAPSWWTAAV